MSFKKYVYLTEYVNAETELMFWIGDVTEWCVWGRLLQLSLKIQLERQSRQVKFKVSSELHYVSRIKNGF